MSWTSGVVVYVIAWWLVFFMTLPIGVKPPHEAGEEVIEGNDPGAPVKPLLLYKVIAASVIAAIISVIVFWIIQSDIITFRQ